MSNFSKAHLRKRSPNFSLFIVIVLLVILGIVFLSSASSVISFQEYGDSRYMFLKQVFGIILGFGLMGVFYKIDVRFWKRIAFPLMVITLISLVAVLIPHIGVAHGGARRWIDLGPIQIQPSDFLKFSAIVYLASLFEKKGREVRDFMHGTLPFLILLGVMVLLVMAQPDMGTLLVVIVIAITMYFVSGAKASHLLGIGAAGIVGLLALIKISPYRMQRFLVFLNPSAYSNHAVGYQTKQALIAIGSGGLIGRGFGQSLQKYRYLPEAATDSIFAIIGEEKGVIGTVGICFLFAAFGFLGYKIAQNARDAYTRLLAVGITSWIVFQAILNICAALSLVPLTGVTLPFISFGGTSIVLAIASSGILLNISSNAQERTENENNPGRRGDRRSRYAALGNHSRTKR